jgi:uncharacterized protein YukE
MGRPTDWKPLNLDSDPTPGDWSAIDQLGRAYTTFANKAQDVHDRIMGITRDGVIAEWTGAAAREFKQQFGDLPGQLVKLHDSYAKAGSALTDFAQALSAAQGKADRALTDAEPLYRELQQKQQALPGLQSSARTAQSASDKLNHPGGNVPKPDENQVRTATRNAQNANTAVTDCSNRIHHLQQQLDDLRKRATDAHGDREHAANHCADQLGKASDAGIHNKHWWEKAWDWVAKNWHYVISALKIIVAIGGIILLFVPGLNLLMIAVLVAAVIVLADTIVKYAQGKAGLGDVLLAALDCVPVLGKLGMLAKAGEMLSTAGKAVKGVSTFERLAGPLSKLTPVFEKGKTIYKMGDDLKGLKGLSVGMLKGFGKDMFKSTAADALNGKPVLNLNNFEKNTFNAGVSNFLGSGVKYGVSTHMNNTAFRTPVVDIGTPGHPKNLDMLDHFGKGTALNEFASGTAKGLTTSVVKEVGNDWLFDSPYSETDNQTNGINILTGTLGGTGGGALGKDYTGEYTGPRG